MREWDEYTDGVTVDEDQERYLEGKRAAGTSVRLGRDPLAEFRGPDGELGTDGPWIEQILDARAAEAEAVVGE